MYKTPRLHSFQCTFTETFVITPSKLIPKNTERTLHAHTTTSDTPLLAVWWSQVAIQKLTIHYSRVHRPPLEHIVRRPAHALTS